MTPDEAAPVKPIPGTPKFVVGQVIKPLGRMPGPILEVRLDPIAWCGIVYVLDYGNGVTVDVDEDGSVLVESEEDV